MQGLFCCVATFLMLSAPAWSADNNKLLDVSVDSGAATPTILVKTAEPVGYRYTVYDSFDPIRVVVDFPGMDIADMPETVSVNQSAVQEVRIAGFDLSSGKLTRVEILLAKSSEYQVNLDGKEFRITFASDPDMVQVAEVAKAPEIKTIPAVAVVASQEANTLNNINLSSGQAILEANGKLGKFQYFTLGNPPRLVVDLYGLKPGFKARSIPANTGFKDVRVGTYNDKTRLVFDSSESMLPEHTVEGRSTDIIVSWGNDNTKTVAAAPVVKQEKASAPAPAPIVAVATPEVVAEKPLKPAPVMSGPVAVEAIDFLNEEGRSVIAVTLSGPAKVSEPVEEGNLIRFELVNVSISRALRRTIDASAFPSAVSSVTPYTVADGDHQNVRIAVDMKGVVAYALEQDGSTVRLVVDDGAYAEPVPAAVSKVEVIAPETPQDAPAGIAQRSSAPAFTPVTADEMAVEAARYTGEKITLVFDSANVRSILQLIGDVSDLNILASSDVGGNVTLRLIDVPWDQALDLVLETAGLGKIQDGNVLRIMPKNKIREIEQTAMKEQTVAIEEGVLETQAFLISYASVDDMKGYLTDIKSDRGSIIADSRNKQLIVRDVAAVLTQMQDMILQIDMPERQVMIEARIVEASTNFSRDLGVKWNFNYDQDVDSSTKSLTVTDATLGLGGAVAIAPAVGAGLGSSVAIAALDDQLDIDLRLQALENSGEGKIVSTPRITTLNGEKATISQGTKIPFSSVSDSGTDVIFENAELKLEVTPEINPDGSILLDINVSNSSVGSVVPTATGDAVSIDEKKAQTKALVRDGQTTVIGGIFIEQETDGSSGVPILKDIPYLGRLFRSTTKKRDRRELLIFITPRIVES
jgi:type IV pilus assembly protein PilQ